jgi:hypothetical protein
MFGLKTLPFHRSRIFVAMVNLAHDFFSIGLLKTRNKDGVDRVEFIGGGVHAGG